MMQVPLAAVHDRRFLFDHRRVSRRPFRTLAHVGRVFVCVPLRDTLFSLVHAARPRRGRVWLGARPVDRDGLAGRHGKKFIDNKWPACAGHSHTYVTPPCILLIA